MKGFLQLVGMLMMFAIAMGIIYGIGCILALVGAMIGIALLALFVVVLVLYGVKQLWKCLFRRRPGA